MEDARPATGAELPRVVELAREFRAELAAIRGGTRWLRREARAEPLEDAYRSLLERDDAAVVVGTIHGSLVGFGTAEIETLADGTRLGHLDDLYVEPDARSVGVGEAVLAALVEFCRGSGCDAIDATALPGHRSAKNFFEGAGFTARALTMHREFDDG